MLRGMDRLDINEYFFGLSEREYPVKTLKEPLSQSNGMLTSDICIQYILELKDTVLSLL